MIHAFRCALLRSIVGLALVVLAGCASSPDRPGDAAAWKDARQLVLVVTDDWNTDHGRLRAYERHGDAWQPEADAAPVTVGRAGAAWGVGLHAPRSDGPVKHEGDGRSAAGVFRIGEAFGYAGQVDTALSYRALTVSDYCVDVDGSPLYNRIVDANKEDPKAVAGSTEAMRLDLHGHGDQRYKLGFVIEHNPDGRRGAGSCIFAHLWRSPTDNTAGCTAMDEAAMRRLLGWLRPEQRPVFVLLPREAYTKLQRDWALPTPDVAP